jgi:flagellar motor switch protein FliM
MSESLRPVDLTGRERHLRAAMTAMGTIASRFARQARRTLPFLVRQRARIEPEEVSLAPSLMHHDSADGPRFEVRLDAESGAWACLGFNAHAIALLLEASLGGGDGAAAPITGDLTLAQSALVGRLGRSLAQDLLAAVEAEAALQLRVVSARALRAGEAGEHPNLDGLVVECNFAGLEPGPKITITMGAEALEAAVREHAEEEAPTADPRIAEALSDVPVEVSAELGRSSIGLRDVLKLRVGQVLRLPTAVDDPVQIRVAGLRKFDATPVISRGQVSVQIRARHGE